MPDSPRVTVVFFKGAGGYAGGMQRYRNGGGMAVLGDWCLDSLADRVPPEHRSWWTGLEKQTGAITHEMGHTWGLMHPEEKTLTGRKDCPYTVMGSWWDRPDYPTPPGSGPAFARPARLGRGYKGAGAVKHAHVPEPVPAAVSTGLVQNGPEPASITLTVCGGYALLGPTAKT